MLSSLSEHVTQNDTLRKFNYQSSQMQQPQESRGERPDHHDDVKTLERETEEVLRCNTAKSMMQRWGEYGEGGVGVKSSFTQKQTGFDQVKPHTTAGGKRTRRRIIQVGGVLSMTNYSQSKNSILQKVM